MLFCIAKQLVSNFVYVLFSALLFHLIQNIPVRNLTLLITKVANH